jgi:hypothetical protein
VLVFSIFLRTYSNASFNAGHRRSMSFPLAEFRSEHLAGTTRSDSELLNTLSKILSSGTGITLHSTKGPRLVRLFLIGDELKWESANATASSKRYRMKLSEILSIYSGKSTTNLKGAYSAADNCCLSLITQGSSLDLEASCELDRNCFVRALSLKLETLHKPPPSKADAN